MANKNQVYRSYLDAVGLQAQATAEAAGLNPTDWFALSLLSMTERMTSGELAEQTGLSTGATTRLIDRLERSGHVLRVADPADRRRVLVQLVPGTLDLDRLVGPARRHLGDVLARYTPEQQEVLFDYFEHAAPAFRAAAHEIRNRARRKIS